jgi:hypothetical protein
MGLCCLIGDLACGAPDASPDTIFEVTPPYDGMIVHSGTDGAQRDEYRIDSSPIGEAGQLDRAADVNPRDEAEGGGDVPITGDGGGAGGTGGQTLETGRGGTGGQGGVDAGLDAPLATGGTTGAGGIVGNGGMGGTTWSGGMVGSGGTGAGGTASGGMVASGGTASGGMVASGGTGSGGTASGGMVGSGGTGAGGAASGGMVASGGTGSGGTAGGSGSGTGGVNGTGGAASGGIVGSGGTGTGGTAATGGIVGSGGSGMGGSGTGGLGGATGSGGSTEAPRLHAFLLLGQSNMAGYARATEADKQSSPRIRVIGFDDCSATGRTKDQWADAAPPLHECAMGAVGPGDWFSKTLLDRVPAGDSILLVPCALSGRSLSDMKKGTANYTWFISRARSAQQLGGVIEGMIFHQGESDCGQSTWPNAVRQFVADLRTDLDLIEDPPFLAGELPRASTCSTHNPLVNQLPGLITNAYVVTSEGLNLDPADTTYRMHFGHDDTVELGKRYAAKMIQALNW